jgi:hypothetical protein
VYRIAMRTRPLIAFALLALVAGCGAVWPNGDPMFPGSSGATTQPASPAKRLYLMNTAVTAAVSGTKAAVDAGLLTQDEVNKAQPFLVAYYAASAEAAKEIKQADADRKAGKPVTDTTAEDAVRQVAAALEPLRPMLLKLNVKAP